MAGFDSGHSSKSRTGKRNSKDIKKNTDRVTILIIVFLLGLLIAAIYFTFSEGISFVTMDTYVTTITQSKVKDDGTPKTVTATYNVEVDSLEVSKDEVESVLIETMNDFTYEEFTGDDAMENLKTSAMANLEQRFGGENVGEVYISDYNANVPLNSGQNVNTESVESRNTIMNGLFKGME